MKNNPVHRRPSFIHRSKAPYDIRDFERIEARRKAGSGYEAIDNFSYMQAWHGSDQGFICFFTRYGYPAARTICCMTSRDGVTWSDWIRLAAIEQGHYQVSASSKLKAATGRSSFAATTA